jgi:hypothetical protein
MKQITEIIQSLRLEPIEEALHRLKHSLGLTLCPARSLFRRLNALCASAPTNAAMQHSVLRNIHV